MSGRIVFPNEPIRVDAGEYVTPRALTAAERAEQDEVFAQWDDMERGDKARCDSCGGDGIFVCDGSVDCPEADDAGCPFTDFHTYRCDDCNGRGFFDINLGKPL